MEINALDFPCYHCKLPLKTVQATKQLGACTQCGKRVLMNESFHEALAIATTNEAWIEKIFWKESNDSFLAVFVVLFIDLPHIMLKYVGWFMVLGSLAMRLSWTEWSIIPAGYVVALVLLPILRRGIEKLFANQFIMVIHFIVSSRGIVLVSCSPQPFLLPWSSIVHYAWSSDVATMTSQMSLSYATVDGQVATIILEGEEKVQPLGELVDILNARLGR